MKYLNRRDEFLKQYNNIINISKNYVNDKNELIKEDGGPFSNDIGWGDSLLGRLINSTIRKAKIGANLVRIKAVEQRLRDAMDEILLNSGVVELDDDDKKMYAKVLISTYLIALQEAVKNGDPLEELKSLTETTINTVESNQDLEGKNELLRQLNEWLNFLNNFKEEEEQESQEENDKSENTVSTTEVYMTNFKNLYQILLIYKGIEKEKLAQERLEQVKSKTKPVTTGLTIGKEYTYTNDKGLKNKVKVLSLTKTKKIGADGKWLTPDDVEGEDLKSGTAFVAFKDKNGDYKQSMAVDIDKIDAAQASTDDIISNNTDTAQGGVTNIKNKKRQEEKTGNENLLLRYDDFIKINEGVAKTAGEVVGKVWKFFTGGKDEREIEKAEYKDTKTLWDTIQPLYKIFEAEGGSLEKENELHRILKLTPEQIEGDAKLRLTYNKYKSNIDKIYGFVRSSNGITEGLHELLGRNEQIGKAIAAIYSVTKSKPDGKFIQYPGTINEVWEEFVKNIAGFNESMKSVFAVESKWKVGDTATWKSKTTGNQISKEILRIDGKKLVFKDQNGKEYTKFMSEVEKLKESTLYNRFNKIYEAQEEEETDVTIDDENKIDDTLSGEVSGWKNPNSINKIQDWWGENMDLKRWMVEKTQVEKIRVNLDKKLAEKKDSIVINGMDPVLEIVKVFNRAYKLHTTQVIPSGRSGGKVSNKTFMEYHSFGGGTPDNAGASGGPYRNIAIFNQWEDCVLDVKKDKKYQAIFNVNTRIKVGNEYIEKAGSNLRKFMTDMLDGDELYKGGSSKEQGAQAKFLDKYFGYKESKDGKDTYYDGDKEAVNETANGINPVSIITLDSNVALKYNKDSDLENTFFLLRLRSDGESRTYYFHIQEVKDGILYLTYSLTAYYMIKYVKKSKGDVSVKSSFVTIDKKDKNGNEYPIKATTIALSKLYSKDGVFGLKSDIEMSSLVKQKDSNDEVNNSISNVSYELEGAKNYKVEKIQHIVSKSDDENRIKVTDKSVENVMKTDGGYKDIRNIGNIKNVKITNR